MINGHYLMDISTLIPNLVNSEAMRNISNYDIMAVCPSLL